MRRRKSGVNKLKNRIKITCIIISVSFIIIRIMISAIGVGRIESIPPPQSTIGEFGERVIEMLPEDLPFTLFLPSDEAFHRDLRLNKTDDDDDGNTYAVLTRILGFSAVPRWISPADLEKRKETLYDSISGFNLYIHKNPDETVVVNGIVSIGLEKKRNLLVHVMDGVVMDPEFEQSVRTDEDNKE